jgi:hypothetical protein
MKCTLVVFTSCSSKSRTSGTGFFGCWIESFERKSAGLLKPRFQFLPNAALTHDLAPVARARGQASRFC